MTRTSRDRDQEDEETSQAWVRDPDDEITAVDALRLRGEKEWPWQVTVPVMEFVRQDPLEDELDLAITAALSRVRGVREAHHEDREVWVVSGRPRGRALAEAAGAALDRLAPRLRVYLDDEIARAHGA